MNRGILLNIDNTHFFHSRLVRGVDVHEEELRRFVRQYEHTQVSDLIFCAAGRIASYPSKVVTSLIDKYLQREENGQPVDYTGTMAETAYDIFVRKGLEPFAIWLEECRSIGVRGWISLRMNDCHDNDRPASLLHSGFYHAYPEYRRITHRPPDGYYDRCFDYAEPAVRKHMLALIDELLERYDMQGLELDWQREAFCFRPGDEYEGAALITDFMREAAGRVRKAASMRGHEILLSARVPADPEDALELGFDAATWAREGLIQTLIPSPRWRTCDTDIPVGLWKRLLAGTGTTLAPCIEILMQPGACRRFYATRDQVVALAEQHFALGGDSTYLFNYFDDPVPERTYWSSNAAHPDMGVRKENYNFLLRTIGDPELTMRARRSHVISERDLRPAWREREHPLPFSCEKPGEYRQTRLCVGRVPAGARVLLKLGIAQGRVEDAVIFAHRKPARLLGATEVRPAYFEHAAYVFEVPNDGSLPPYLLLEIATKGVPLTIDYIEVCVAPNAKA